MIPENPSPSTTPEFPPFDDWKEYMLSILTNHFMILQKQFHKRDDHLQAELETLKNLLFNLQNTKNNVKRQSIRNASAGINHFMPFGKYEGWRLVNIPIYYLDQTVSTMPPQWLTRQAQRMVDCAMTLLEDKPPGKATLYEILDEYYNEPDIPN